ncbi:MAG: transcriptional repressor [Acidobacteria bacterium]|nr:transcriptional repressor [Acidobacteriota bacterium]
MGAGTAGTGGSWAQVASARLAEAGYRQGGARLAVIELLDGQSCTLTAQEIEDALGDSRRSVGRASVYRILDELEEVGVLTRVELGRGQAGYEPVRPEHHHHHMVCDRCGRVEPFDDSALEEAIASVSSSVDFEVTGHDVTLRGLCRRCRLGAG